MNVRMIVFVVAVCMLAAAPPKVMAEPGSDQPAGLESDRPASIRFFGSPEAELYSREVDESFKGALRKNYISQPGGEFPVGFVHASPPGQAWSGTMWTRDGGTFMRELVMWGCYEHAAQLAECLIHQVQKNQDGFYSFPEYFKGAQPGTGTELDGTTSIIIGMVLVWQRLPDSHPTRGHISEFLLKDEASPVRYLKHCLQSAPLVAGSGEFGGGCGIPGEHFNVVQNNLAMLALLAAGNMAQEAGRTQDASKYRQLAAGVREAMEKYLVDDEGCWIWCVEPKTLKPDPAIVNHEINRGFGGLNGVASMYSDVLGFEPLASGSKNVQHCEKTFARLYAVPLRKQQFERYGIWTQFDVFRAGLASSPSYSDGYALQMMLLYDKLEMADKSLSWVANSTYRPVPEYKVDRESPYFFYEGSYSPDAVGKVPLEQGCGALNQIGVTEQLKVCRLVLGVDDTSSECVRVIPRVSPSWKGVEAHNWPIRTTGGIVRADIRFEKKGTGAALSLKVVAGGPIGKLKVRMPSAKGNVWQERKDVSAVEITSE